MNARLGMSLLPNQEVDRATPGWTTAWLPARLARRSADGHVRPDDSLRSGSGDPPPYAVGRVSAGMAAGNHLAEDWRCLRTEEYELAEMWSLSNRPVSGPWRMDRLGLGYHLGTALQDTIRHNAKQSCRTLFILGDPTLTGFTVAPPGTPSASRGTAPCDGNGRWVYLSWSAAPEPVDGYYVYRGTSLESAIQNGRLFPGHITTTSYEDCAPGGETYIYAVRAVKLTQSGAGSFYNLSRAASVTFTVSP